MLLSVVVCTFNPRKKNLDRTLEGLHKQTLPLSEWELIIVDNASSVPIIQTHPIRWHQNIKYCFESRQGLIFARLKGISEASTNLLVFFDDDNIPAPSFLESVVSIAAEFPFVGVFGGSCIAEYEKIPSDYLLKYTGMMAIRAVERIVFSNLYLWDTTPSGAGMVVRKEIAEQFVDNVNGNKISMLLGRSGNGLMSGEDNELSYTAIDMGFACGLFPQLNLVHIIPSNRVEPAYLLKLSKYIAASNVLLSSLRPNYSIFYSMAAIRPIFNELRSVFRLEKSSMQKLWFEWRRFWYIRKGEKLAKTILSKVSNV